MAGALKRAAERLTGDSSGEQPDRLAARMVTLDQEIGRLVEALAQGEAISHITGAIQSRQVERAGLVERMRALETLGPDIDEIRRELAAIVEDHRSALVNNGQESRDLLKVLIEDRLVVHPVDGEAEWELRGMGSLEALVVRAAKTWRPHRDSVPLAQANGLRRKPRNRWGRSRPSPARKDSSPRGHEERRQWESATFVVGVAA